MSEATGSGVLGLSLPWTRRALIASLVLNCLLIGAAIGVGVKATEKRHHGSSAFIARQIADLTGAESDDAERAAMKKAHAERRAARRGWSEELEAALRRTPYDPDAAAAIFASRRAERLAIVTERHEAMLAEMAELSDDERAELAGRMAERMEDRGKED